MDGLRKRERVRGISGGRRERKGGGKKRERERRRGERIGCCDCFRALSFSLFLLST